LYGKRADRIGDAVRERREDRAVRRVDDAPRLRRAVKEPDRVTTVGDRHGEFRARAEAGQRGGTDGRRDRDRLEHRKAIAGGEHTPPLVGELFGVVGGRRKGWAARTTRKIRAIGRLRVAQNAADPGTRG
jgi:hypothetical protein